MTLGALSSLVIEDYIVATPRLNDPQTRPRSWKDFRNELLTSGRWLREATGGGRPGTCVQHGVLSLRSKSTPRAQF